MVTLSVQGVRAAAGLFQQERMSKLFKKVTLQPSAVIFVEVVAAGVRFFKGAVF